MKTKNVRLMLILLAGAALIAAGVWWYGEYRTEANRRTYFVLFEDVRGLIAEAGVYFRGIEVGRVAEIGLEGDKVRVAVRVDADLDVRRDATLFLTSQGLLGESIVEFADLGKSSERASSGDLLQGSSRGTLGLRRIAERVNTSFDELIAAIHSLRRVEQRLQRVEEKLDRLLARSGATRNSP